MTGGPNADHFRNRKGYFSLNIQTISNSHLDIQEFVARWPEMVYIYEVRSYLLAPLATSTIVVEQLYNESQIQTRNVAGRTYGVWKRRFPLLSLGMRVHIQLAQNIIVATAVLHNKACQHREDHRILKYLLTLKMVYHNMLPQHTPSKKILPSTITPDQALREQQCYRYLAVLPSSPPTFSVCMRTTVKHHVAGTYQVEIGGAAVPQCLYTSRHCKDHKTQNLSAPARRQRAYYICSDSWVVNMTQDKTSRGSHSTLLGPNQHQLMASFHGNKQVTSMPRCFYYTGYHLGRTTFGTHIPVLRIVNKAY
uniref:(California timema) hypothetical protein n=1 Tax=Timema californicum TaxID=61474 RepID=A0A7R9JER9_TIMCA|nr:unnamed protein product [Timema californicum]